MFTNCNINPFVPTVAFNICCPRDCVSRHKGGTSGAPLKPLGDDSALRALSCLRGLRGAPEVPSLCWETQSLGQQMLNATVGTNGLSHRLFSGELRPGMSQFLEFCAGILWVFPDWGKLHSLGISFFTYYSLGIMGDWLRAPLNLWIRQYCDVLLNLRRTSQYCRIEGYNKPLNTIVLLWST